MDHYQRCMVVRGERLGKRHSSYADSLNNVAIIYDQKHEHKEALSHYEECLQIQEEVLGINHADCARTLTNMG